MNFWGYDRTRNQSLITPLSNQSFASIPIIRSYQALRQDDFAERFSTNRQTRHLTPDDIVSDLRGSCFSCKRLIDDNYIRHLSIFYQLVREETTSPLPRNTYKPWGAATMSRNQIAKRSTQSQDYSPWQWDNPYLEHNVSVQSMGRAKMRDEATSTSHNFGSTTTSGTSRSPYYIQNGRQNLDSNRSTPIDFDNPDLYVDQILSQMNGPNDWRNEIYANDMGQSYTPIRMSEVKRIIETNVEYPLIANSRYGLTSPTYSYTEPPIKKVKKISKPTKDAKSSKRKSKPKKKSSKKKASKKKEEDVSSVSTDSYTTDDSTLNVKDSEPSSKENNQKRALKNGKDKESASPTVEKSSSDTTSASLSLDDKIREGPVISENDLKKGPKAEIQNKLANDDDDGKNKKDKVALEKDQNLKKNPKLNEDAQKSQKAPLKEAATKSSEGKISSDPAASNKTKTSIPLITPSIVVSSPSMTSNITDLPLSKTPSGSSLDKNKIESPKQQGLNKKEKQPVKTDPSIAKLVNSKHTDGKGKEIQTKFQLPNHPTLSSKEKLDIMGRATEIGNKSSLKQKETGAKGQASKS